MENAEAINSALIELEKVDVDKMPEQLQQAVIHAHMTLISVSDALEGK